MVVLVLDLYIVVEFGSRLAFEDMDSRISEAILEEEADDMETWLLCSDIAASLGRTVEGTIAIVGLPVPGGIGAVDIMLVGTAVELLLVAMLVAGGSGLVTGESDIAQESRPGSALWDKNILDI